MSALSSCVSKAGTGQELGNLQSQISSFVFSSLDSKITESKEADEWRAGRSEDNEIVTVMTTCESGK